ncbi:TPA: hypothetical protein I1462_001882 [Staphylococcus pseudintermedius]|uniref:Uncharacterized protein n=3 Tax=Coventryvirus TaxID=2843370 RepID=A0A1J0MFC8_9CAUD|nr:MULTISPECIES: hypothetical protein [Staphylococcus intermedius group]YP_010081718.1 hypothetical protein KMD10_gp29 [Staphylococcus phage SP120]YP_010082009.1 hypothetical protein KMD14_gp42 [Staphylococcus phage vB_SpsM_WIS42]APD19907.1 hypothetical protein SpT252_024 [Staphylococcus phage SpT252]UVT35121.1 hypothetical protein VL4_ORF39 [Staphylococcus phage vB_SpsS_VL4]ANQ88897.1 hypothetical protein A9I65_09885 [Staphylococcus pseudintermedius]EGQ0293636.1 hypothetical protein [Staphyl
MQYLIAWFNTVAVAIVLTTILAFAGVYFTTILFVVILAEVLTYNGTKAIYEALKKTDSNGNC